MNLKVVLPPVIIVVLGLGALSSVQNTGFREHIESTLKESAQEALSAAGLVADVEFSGRDADVTAPSDAAALAAAGAVGEVTGVRTAAAYGPNGLVPAEDGGTEAPEAAGEPVESETSDASGATPDASASPEASASSDVTASPEATGATSDDDTAAGTDEDDSAEEEDEPEREPTREEREQAQEDLVEIPNITFVTDSAKLTKDGRRVVREAAEILDQHPEVEVRIEGHTDSVGTEAHNQRLSERRAQAVLDRLVELGVAEDRLTAKGYGESDPLVVPRTFADLEKNRRVEFTVRA